MPRGLIIRSTGSWYDIKDESSSTLYKGRLRGKFKNKGLKTTNPIAVGDYVDFDVEDNEDQSVVIHKIHPRKNYIIRQSIHKHAHGQLLASNIDQCILMVTLKFPETSLGFIDRYLVVAESFRIPVTIVFNKADIYSDEELEQVHEMIEIYASIGYKTILTSVEENYGLGEVQEHLRGKINLISGHSGVGKSSLLNKLDPTLQRTVREISTYYDKGTHTTTFAEMVPLGEDTWIIDSPGISELGLYEIDKSVLSHYFPEMREHLGNCRFNNCIHIKEPGCAVKEAYENDQIAPSRFYNYISMMEDDDFKRK